MNVNSASLSNIFFKSAETVARSGFSFSKNALSGITELGSTIVKALAQCCDKENRKTTTIGFLTTALAASATSDQTTKLAFGIIGVTSCCYLSKMNEKRKTAALDLGRKMGIISSRYADPDWNNDDIAKAIMAIQESQKEKVLKLAYDFATPDMNGLSRARLIKRIAAIPVEERNNIVQKAEEFSSLNHTFGSKKVDILELIAANYNEIEALIEHEKDLLLLEDPIHKDGYFQGLTLGYLINIPKMERETAVAQIKAFKTIHTNKISFWELLSLIRVIPSAEREERLNRVSDHLEQNPNENENPRIRELLETPLNEPLPLWHGDMVQQAAAGNQAVNVHAGSRDAKTIDALALLRDFQGAIDEKTIKQNVQEFTDYLTNVQGISETERERALFALNGPPKKSDFGPLLGDQTCNTYNISGDEAIARHWLFTNQYQDPQGDSATVKDRENAKLGMIKALSISYTFDGVGPDRICNEGKVQRQAVLVLQGRLPGVNIDGMPTPTARQAAELFFNVESHRTIESKTELLAAATKYCKENPLIPQAAFLIEIEKRAKHGEKIQGLAVSSPQGPLTGANIDHTPRPTARQAAEMFFNVERHRMIETKADLLAAATKYCEENPLIPYLEFIAEIEDCARELDLA